MPNLTENEIYELMKSDAYNNPYHPDREKTHEKVKNAFKSLYPDDDRDINPEKYYIWRTEGDNRVRSSHADREGEVFSKDNPPSGGHPGEDWGCRCWAEEYTSPQKDSRLMDKMLYSATGAVQGLSLGWSDEIEGAMGATGYGVGNLLSKGSKESFKGAIQRGYQEYRSIQRQDLKEGYENEPVITGISEAIGAIANPIGVFRAAKTAPLTIKNKVNLLDAMATGIIYGTGVSSTDVEEYFTNIGLGMFGNIGGHLLSNKALGRAGNPIARKSLNESANWALKQINDLKNMRRKNLLDNDK